MSDSQHFCLKWNNHQSTLVSLFPSLLDTNTFVDCTLAAGGKQLQAHKVVLSACSPYFKELLVQHNDKHPIIILNNLNYGELVAIVDFMYKGEVNISQDHLADFLKVAKALQIKGLTDHKTSEEPPATSEEVEKAAEAEDRREEEKGDARAKDLSMTEVLSNSDNSVSDLSVSATIKKEKWDDESQEIDCDDFDDQEMEENNTVPLFPYNIPFTSLAGDMSITKNFSETSYPHSLVTNSMEFLQRVFPRQVRKCEAEEATFACETCGKRYRSKTSLNLHRRWECGKEPRFKCPFCDKRTHQKGNLKVHIMSRHRDYVSTRTALT